MTYENDVVFDYMNTYVENCLWSLIEDPDDYGDDDVIKMFRNGKFEVDLSYIFAILTTFDLDDDDFDELYDWIRSCYVRKF